MNYILRSRKLFEESFKTDSKMSFGIIIMKEFNLATAEV